MNEETMQAGSGGLLAGESFARLYYEQGVLGLPYKRRAVMQLWNGQPCGPCTYYYRNGHKQAEGEYDIVENRVVMVGLWNFYDQRGGRLGFINHNLVGQRHGEYHSEANGVILARGHYRNGRPTGNWLMWDACKSETIVTQPLKHGPAWEKVINQALSDFMLHTQTKAKGEK